MHLLCAKYCSSLLVIEMLHVYDLVSESIYISSLHQQYIKPNIQHYDTPAGLLAQGKYILWFGHSLLAHYQVQDLRILLYLCILHRWNIDLGKYTFKSSCHWAGVNKIWMLTSGLCIYGIPQVGLPSTISYTYIIPQECLDSVIHKYNYHQICFIMQ